MLYPIYSDAIIKGMRPNTGKYFALGLIGLSNIIDNLNKFATIDSNICIKTFTIKYNINENKNKMF